MPRILVLFVKLGAHILAAVAARTLNRHIPLISALRISVRLSACVLCTLHQADNLAKLRQEFLSLLELIAKIFCAVVIARTSEALGNTQPRVAVAYAPFEQ